MRFPARDPTDIQSPPGQRGNRADEGIRPYECPGQRVATAQLLVALPSYGCGVLPAGKRNARKEEPVEHW